MLFRSASGGLSSASVEKSSGEPPEEPEAFAATGIDNAIDLLEVVTAKMDKASVGQRAAGIEQHPEASNDQFRRSSHLIYKHLRRGDLKQHLKRTKSASCQIFGKRSVVW